MSLMVFSSFKSGKLGFFLHSFEFLTTFFYCSPPETKSQDGAQESGGASSKSSEEVASKSNEVTCNGDHHSYETNESELE